MAILLKDRKIEQTTAETDRQIDKKQQQEVMPKLSIEEDERHTGWGVSSREGEAGDRRGER